MKKGFTLIELLVVIGIITLLSSIILASLNSARAKARDAQRISNVKQLQTAVEYYYDDHGTYPPLGTDGVNYNITGSALVTELQPYLPSIAPDPTGAVYQYLQSGNPAICGSGASQCYAVYVYQEKTASWCKTGVNVRSDWWGGVTLNCNF